MGAGLACTFVPGFVLPYRPLCDVHSQCLPSARARGYFCRLVVEEMNAIGLQSLGIVALLSVFMGAVICIQTAHQIGGWIPVYTIGFTVRKR